MRIKDMAIIAMFTALTAVLSQISIPLPFSPVPITLQTFAVYLTGIILGCRKGTLALLVYALIGLFGLPVFSQGKSGLPVLVGPTGGYIFGFILAVYIVGKIIERSDNISFLRSLWALIFGFLIIYALGVGQLQVVLGLSFKEAFVIGALPYLILELVKIMIGAYLGCTVRKAMQNAFPDL
ncbi:MAG: biotin transporter BioY [Dehalobacterium sp.]